MTENYLNNLFDLKGKTAVLFGGTGELISSIAHGFAGAGMNVVLGGRDADKAERRIKSMQEAFPGTQALFCKGEVNSRKDIQDTLDAAVAKFGKVDVLVNGAGVNAPTPFLDIPEDEFQRIIDINLKGVLLACQVFGRYFLESNQSASIINITSISSRIPLSKVFTYSASKAAVLNLTHNLGREWAKSGIRVNALTPGFFPAEQNRKILTPERTEQILRHTPMGRFGDAHELVGAALLLASTGAASFITGQEFVVDGGFSAMTI